MLKIHLNNHLKIMLKLDNFFRIQSSLIYLEITPPMYFAVDTSEGNHSSDVLRDQGLARIVDEREERDASDVLRGRCLRRNRLIPMVVDGQGLAQMLCSNRQREGKGERASDASSVFIVDVKRLTPMVVDKRERERARESDRSNLGI